MIIRFRHAARRHSAPKVWGSLFSGISITPFPSARGGRFRLRRTPQKLLQKIFPRAHCKEFNMFA